MQGRRATWEELCAKLRAQQEQGSPPTAAAYKDRAQVAEHQLLLLCSRLASSPDPVPLLQSAARLALRVVGAANHSQYHCTIARHSQYNSTIARHNPA
jgi:hypothetical protein